MTALTFQDVRVHAQARRATSISGMFVRLAVLRERAYVMEPDHVSLTIQSQI